MNINKIKKAFSFIGMEGVATKITTLSLISGIGVLLFTQYLIPSSSSKTLLLPQNQEFTKIDLSEEDYLNGKAFSGELMNELVVLSSPRSRESFPDVYMRAQNFINPANAKNSKCVIQGKARPISQRSSMGISRPATINIDFTEVTCEVNGIFETHKIEGHIWNIKAETVPAPIAFKNKIQSLNDNLKTETDEKVIAVERSLINQLEKAGPVIVLPARTQIQGLIHRHNGKVVIDTLN
jgi:hypothetical protein